MAEAVHIILDKEAENKAETRGLALKARPLVKYLPTLPPSAYEPWPPRTTPPSGEQVSKPELMRHQIMTGSCNSVSVALFMQEETEALGGWSCRSRMTADMVTQSNPVVFTTENNLLAFLFVTENTPRAQEGVSLALRQTLLWEKPEGIQGTEGTAGSSSVTSPECWGGDQGRVGPSCTGDMFVIAAVMG